MNYSIEQLLQIIIIDASDLIDVADEIRSDVLNGGIISEEDIKYLQERLNICLANVDKIDCVRAECE